MWPAGAGYADGGVIRHAEERRGGAQARDPGTPRRDRRCPSRLVNQILYMTC